MKNLELRLSKLKDAWPASGRARVATLRPHPTLSNSSLLLWPLDFRTWVRMPPNLISCPYGSARCGAGASPRILEAGAARYRLSSCLFCLLALSLCLNYLASLCLSLCITILLTASRAAAEVGGILSMGKGCFPVLGTWSVFSLVFLVLLALHAFSTSCSHPRSCGQASLTSPFSTGEDEFVYPSTGLFIFFFDVVQF